MVRGVVALAAHAAVLGAPPAASGFRTDPPPPSDSLPVWSPDDSAIVFWSFRSLGLRVVEPDGGRERALGLPFGVLSPDWRWLAYVDFAKPPVIELMRPDGSERRTLVAGGQPSWAPDGTRLALSASSSVYTIRTDGTDLRELVTQADTPLWSRDGSWIAFRHLAPLVDRTDFGIAPADGTQVRARAQARGARVLARIDRVVARRRDRRALPRRRRLGVAHSYARLASAPRAPRRPREQGRVVRFTRLDGCEIARWNRVRLLFPVVS